MLEWKLAKHYGMPGRPPGSADASWPQGHGVAQPAIARIESARVVPRVDTLDRVLRGCGRALEVGPHRGEGIDRTAIRELLKLTPKQRLELTAQEANNLSNLAERAQAR